MSATNWTEESDLPIIDDEGLTLRTISMVSSLGMVSAANWTEESDLYL